MSSESFYEQKRYGFAELLPRKDVIVLDQKLTASTDRKGTEDYSKYIVRASHDLRSQGWTTRIAAESHRDDDAVKSAWQWKFGKSELMMEYFLAEYMSLENIQFTAGLHNGMGWRFPKLYVFDRRRPGENELAVFRQYKVPYVVLTGDPELPPTDEPTVHDKLDHIITLLESE